MGDARNVVLLCLDTVRADAFQQFCTRLQDRADRRYTQCRAASSWSLPSHASMFTGTLPSQHGIHAYNRDFADLDRTETFLEDLPNHRALGASANVWAGPAFGFDELFDEFYAISPDRRFPDGLDVASFGQSVDSTGVGKYLAFVRAALAHDRPLRSLANGGFVALERAFARAPIPKPFDDGAKTICRQSRDGIVSSDEPTFLFANLMDAHGPLHHVRGYDRSLHDAPLTWSSDRVDWMSLMNETEDLANHEDYRRYRGLYHAAVEYLDRVVDGFVAEVQSATDRPTAVIVTADHGDNFGLPEDDRRWGHVESSLTEGLLHVPLVVITEDGLDGEEVEGTPCSHCSLPELVIALADGRSLPELEEPILAERIGHSGRLADADQRRGTPEDRMRRAVYRGSRKYVWDATGDGSVYELDPDRPNWQSELDEEIDGLDHDTRYFDTPIAEYERRAKATARDRTLDAATERRLEELGYR